MLTLLPFHPESKGALMDNGKPTEEPVLVVDDEPSICQIVAAALRSEGYRPITCTHPREALTVCEQEAFGLAFIDINLPEITGLQLASKLKDHDPQREVVFITGYGTFDIAVQAIKIGAYDYLRKPFGVTEIKLCLKRYQQRQALRERIRLSEQRYFDLVQNVPLLIFVLRSDFNLEFVNNASTVMLGYGPDEAVNTPNWFLERIYSEDRDRIRKIFQAAFESDVSPFSAECRFTHKEGHLIHAIVKSIPYSPSEAGRRIKRLEGIMVDITDRVFLEGALVQKEKLKTLGAISAEVAHEIRNPLVSIGGFARRLQKKLPNLHESGIILRESQRLEKILDRIRNYLKPVEFRQQECSVNTVITECVDLLSPEIDRKRILCRLNLDPRSPTVYADPDVLTQIVINLIRNAAEAMDQGGTLSVKTFESDQNVHMDFKNQVLGPKVKDPELLFLPFDEGGQSIGLPLCYRLLKNMGGLLSFAQEEKQMVFTVSLPKMESQFQE